VDIFPVMGGLGFAVEEVYHELQADFVELDLFFQHRFVLAQHLVGLRLLLICFKLVFEVLLDLVFFGGDVLVRAGVVVLVDCVEEVGEAVVVAALGAFLDL
jgi:membrane-anchored glycerophosphoryl diester phosphodiesterase (GDPDase)